MNDFSSLTLSALQTSLAAGNLLKRGFQTHFKIQKKEGMHNLVTEWDLQSEKEILASLKKAFPTHGFYSEEKDNAFPADKEIVWVIDPLDGTVNFAHGIPIFCVSIAATKNKKPFLGVIYQPMTEELFVAEKGKGAFLNGKKLQVSQNANISDAFLATGLPYLLKENPDLCIERLVSVLKQGLPVRRLGSAAIDLSYVAAGRFDSFWENNLKPWDIAAGILLIEEAGGKVSDWSGKFWEMKENNAILASNGKIHEDLLSLITVKK
jgi:myo-inositol-1(or 4)-monophosphatase